MPAYAVGLPNDTKLTKIFETGGDNESEIINKYCQLSSEVKPKRAKEDLTENVFARYHCYELNHKTESFTFTSNRNLQNQMSRHDLTRLPKKTGTDDFIIWRRHVNNQSMKNWSEKLSSVSWGVLALLIFQTTIASTNLPSQIIFLFGRYHLSFFSTSQAFCLINPWMNNLLHMELIYRSATVRDQPNALITMNILKLKKLTTNKNFRPNFFFLVE